MTIHLLAATAFLRGRRPGRELVSSGLGGSASTIRDETVLHVSGDGQKGLLHTYILLCGGLEEVNVVLLG